MATQHEQKSVYRVQGFTCAGCAAKFEQNVKEIPGVMDAQVNFGASKITVYGDASVEQIEKAGAFEGLKIFPDTLSPIHPSTPFWKQPSFIKVLLATFSLGLGWLMSERTDQLSILFYLLAILIGGYDLFVKGIRNLIRLDFDMNTLMTIAIIGAAAIGEWNEGATVVILFAISERLESYSMEKARQSIRSLINIAPKHALIRRGNEEMEIPVAEIQIEDIMIVKPGQRCAMDGIVVKGVSSVNQSAITGESIPVAKSVGDEVFAGTLNEEGLLEVKVTKRVEDTTIAKIIHLVEEAQAERAPAQAFIDRFAKVYTPAILLASLTVAILPPLLLHGDWNEWIYRGLAMLVVGCPCALVISTPVSIVTAIGNAAQNGVLIKGGIHLEEAGTLSVIAFDKTGTLTKGIPVVTDLISSSEEKEKEYLTIAAALEKHSQHPLASAIIQKAEQASLPFHSLSVDHFASLVGRGVQATINGKLYLIGSPALFEEQLPNGIAKEIRTTIQTLQTQGKTVMILGTETEALLLIAVADEIRESSIEVLKHLHQLGMKKIVILTGDNKATAKAIGKKIGVDHIEAELLPEQKLEWIKRLQIDGTKVAMVGDGVNDAPALATATVGIAMGGAGTDTALETADIALMADDLRKLPFTIKLSRKTLQIIKQNITFSLAIKVLALLLIIPGMLTLWMAVFADMGATLIVTLNSLRLLRVNI